MKEPEGIPFPTGPRNPAGWDSFWQEVLMRNSADEMDSLRLLPDDFQYRHCIDPFQEMGVRKVWFGGNGISVLPHCISHSGFEVSALDISGAAVEYCRNNPIEEWFLSNFFHYPVGRSIYERALPVAADPRTFVYQARTAVSRAHRPGGSVRFAVGDLFADSTSGEEFEAAFLLDVLRHFPAAERREAARHVYRRLRPGGLLVIYDELLRTGTDISGYVETMESELESAGFLIYGKAQRVKWREARRRRWWRVTRPWRVPRVFNRGGEGGAEDLTTLGAAAKHEARVEMRAGQKLAHIGWPWMTGSSSVGE